MERSHDVNTDVSITKTGLFKRYEGIFYSFLTGLSAVVMGSIMKYLHKFNPAELNMYSFMYVAVFTLPFIISTGLKVERLDKKTVVLWSLNVFFSLSGSVTKAGAFQILPLGDASAIIFSGPIFTAIFARIILKDHLSRMLLISLLLSLIGLLLTVKLPELVSWSAIGSLQHIIGCCYGFACVFCIAGSAITKRSLRHITPVLTTFVGGVGTAALSAALSPIYGKFNYLSCSAIEIPAILALGGSTLAYTFFINQALQTEDPTTVTITIRTADIILSFLVQVLVFQDAADAYSVSGALLAFGSGLLIPLQRWMNGKPEASHWRISWFLK